MLGVCVLGSPFLIVVMVSVDVKQHFIIGVLTAFRHRMVHTPSIAFRHLPPNSARFGYATEGALSISAQLSTRSAPSERFGTDMSFMTVEAT